LTHERAHINFGEQVKLQVNLIRRCMSLTITIAKDFMSCCRTSDDACDCA